jgi:putative CocE/NonD family hydrolase
MFLFSFSLSIYSQEIRKGEISQVLLKIIDEDGIDVAIEHYWYLKETDSSSYDFSNNELNDLGYQLLNAKRYSEAIEIFELNTKVFPDVSNCWNSLAEAYMLAGERESASDAYKRNFELNPNNMIAMLLAYNLKNYTKHVYDIPMRDGIMLKTIVYIPVDESRRYPFLMRRTPYGIAPYGKNEYKYWLGTYPTFAEKGYIFVYQDVRGKFMSEGEFVEMRPFNPNKSASDVDESTDAFDTIEWLLNNIPNNNGKVGMYGFSFPAYYSLMGVLSQHPSLAAVSLQASPANIFIGDDFHRNGAFYLLESVNFFKTNGIPRSGLTTKQTQNVFDYSSPDLYSFFMKVGALKNWNEKYFRNELPFWNDMMEHGRYDEFWKKRDVLPHLSNINTAVQNVAGWYDAEDLYGPLNIYRTIEENNPEIFNQIVIGPWYHGAWTRKEGNRQREILVNSSDASEYYLTNVELPFFEYHLKGKGKLETPEALVYNTGLLKWDSLSSWPPKNVVKKSFFFGPNNSLNEASPLMGIDSGNDEFISDPKKPVPYSYKIEGNWNYDFMITDQRFAARRPDVLYYETQVLKENISVVGDIDITLFVSTTGTDADWFVKVIDVYPENERDFKGISDNTHMGEYQSLVRLGVMRGKFRNSFEKPEPFEPDTVTKINLKLNDINHTFKKGHTIMVQVQSTCFPLFDINPQKFMDIYNADKSDFQRATHKVFYSKEHLSKITFKVANY